MHYLVIAESRNAGPNSYGEGLAVVDPKSRQADRFAFESYPYENYGDHLCVALDDANPKLYTSAGPSAFGPPILEYDLQGNRIAKIAARTLGPLGGGLVRMELFKPGGVLLYTMRHGNEGLWSRTLAPAYTNRQLAKIPDAYDVTALGRVAYVSTYKSGTASKLLAVDYLNGRPPKEIKLKTGGLTVGACQALAADPTTSSLILGDDNGNVFRVNPTNGNTTRINALTGTAPVVALAVDGAAVYVASATGVWVLGRWGLPVPPLYAVPARQVIYDIAASASAGGGVLFFGDHRMPARFPGPVCKGSNGKLPRMAFGGYPTQGNQSFRIAMADGPANGAFLLFVGLSRRSWAGKTLPLSLGLMGAPGCNLLVSPDVPLGGKLLADGSFRINVPVPTNAALVGAHVMAQFGIADQGANAAGLTATDAIELILR
ncbi:MAG: hypothetical protein ACYTGW_18060 [Planctomycetota bacterium]|jgi:hypothetical protein